VESDIAGYRVHFGTDSDTLEFSRDLGFSNAFDLSSLDPGKRFYLAVSAYDWSGNESPLSALLAFDVPADSGAGLADTFFHGYPNPFNDRITFWLVSSAAGPLRLAVFDASGREVVTIHDGVLKPGLHAFLWDGMTRSRRRVSSGTYLAVFECDGRRSVRKCLCIR
jgi:hypothetical protein